MLLCVILVWPTKFENFLSFMQNMFVVWEFKDNWLKTLFLGHLGSIQVFFLRALHLILMHFIHKIQYFEEFLQKIALFFKKNCVFQIFDWSKMRLKFWFELDRFDCYSIGSRSIEGIFDRSNLIFDQSKIVQRVF